MNSPKISVVIPVYNVDKYLHQCMDSVLMQPMRNIEIICINDGSTDRSPDILDKYAQKDFRVRVLHQKNLHAGIARNNGINMARGEYIHFLDADDFLVENAYEAVYKEAKRLDADNLKFRVHTIDAQTGEAGKDIYDNILNLSIIPKEYFGKVLNFSDHPELFTMCILPQWNGLYKRSFIIDNKIKFDDMRNFNDHTFYHMILMNAHRIVYSDNYVLTYRKNISTSLLSSGLNNFECQIEIYQLMNERTRFLSPLLRYLFLGIELKSIIYLYNRSKESGQNWNFIKSETHRFLENMDSSDFNNIIHTEPWNYYYLKNLADVCSFSEEKLKLTNRRIRLKQQPYYIDQFPFHLIKNDHKVAIYGAGAVGKRTVSVMEEMGYGKPCIWVDRNYKRISVDGYYIGDPDELKNIDFEYIIIAIEDKNIIKDVQEFLLDQGIPSNKIVWRDTGSIAWINE
jgi:glycosyltransferase involved in cell wall biosynthesis